MGLALDYNCIPPKEKTCVLKLEQLLRSCQYQQKLCELPSQKVFLASTSVGMSIFDLSDPQFH